MPSKICGNLHENGKALLTQRVGNPIQADLNYCENQAAKLIVTLIGVWSGTCRQAKTSDSPSFHKYLESSLTERQHDEPATWPRVWSGTLPTVFSLVR